MSETILLVEDDDAVRHLLSRGLQARGYRVLEAESGEQAEALVARHDGSVDLLLADVVMRGESGPELARRLREGAPQLPLLYISGYPDRDGIASGDGRQAFLQKPFTIAHLAASVRVLLDGPSAA